MPFLKLEYVILRGGSTAAATSKMECFVIIVNGFLLSQSTPSWMLPDVNYVTKRSILNVAAALDPPLILLFYG